LVLLGGQACSAVGRLALFVIRPSRDVHSGFLDAIALLLSVHVAVAARATPWLIEGSNLDVLAPLVYTDGEVPGS
jgi:hypothetical protein